MIVLGVQPLYLSCCLYGLLDPSHCCIHNIDTIVKLSCEFAVRNLFWLTAFLPLVKVVIDLIYFNIDLARMNIGARRWVIFNFSTRREGKVTRLWVLWTMSQRCFSCCWCSVNPWPMLRCLPFKARNIDERLQRPGRWDRTLDHGNEVVQFYIPFGWRSTLKNVCLHKNEGTLTTVSACQISSEVQSERYPWFHTQDGHKYRRTQWQYHNLMRRRNTVDSCREKAMAIEKHRETWRIPRDLGHKELLQFLSLNLQGRHGRVRRWLRSNRPMGMVPASQLFLRGEHVVGISQKSSSLFLLLSEDCSGTVFTSFRMRSVIVLETMLLFLEV